jgi:hypothetical protein
MRATREWAVTLVMLVAFVLFVPVLAALTTVSVLFERWRARRLHRA